MNVVELQRLTSWIDAHVASAKILQYYQALQGILQQNAQPNEAKQPFEKQKDTLVTALRKVPLLSLTNEQLALLKKLKIADHVGSHGVTVLEDLLYKNSLDIATVVNKLGQISNDINAGISKSNQIKEGLKGCVDTSTDNVGDEAVVRVTFAGDASIDNVVALKKWGEVWHDVSRGIALIHDAAPEEMRVVGASRGSIILELASTLAIVKTVSLIMLEVLKVAERVLQVRRQVEEVRSLRLSNDKAEKELLSAMETERKEGVEAITKVVLDHVGYKNKKKDGEKEIALERSVKHLVDFTTKGGAVDFVTPNASNPESSSQDQLDVAEMNALSDNIREIHRVEARIRQLEHKPRSIDEVN